MVSTSTRGGAGDPATIRRVASMPSMTGIRTSISTTSGASERTAETRGDPVRDRADHLEVVLQVQDRGEAVADQLLVVGEQHPDVSRRAPAGSAARARTAKPPSRSGPAEKVPPSAVTRSRIPRSPLPAPSSVPPGAPRPSSVTSTADPVGPRGR